MFGSQMLEVAIGVIFVFLLVSVVCSAIREGLEAWLKTRAAYLERGIRSILNDSDGEGIAKDLYKHPLIGGLFTGKYASRGNGKLGWLFKSGGNLPSYIPSKNFALALMDIAARGPEPGAASDGDAAPLMSLPAVRSNIANIRNPEVQRALLSAIDSAQGSLNQAQANIEAWFDSGMDRVSGWYKRSTQWIIFAIGLGVAVGLNVNAISIAQHLYREDALRAAVLERARSVGASPTSIETFDEAKKQLDTALPIGWGVAPGFSQLPSGGDSADAWRDWFLALVLLLFGWLITAFAASMGAPFWFDLLNKFMVIRSTVKPHEKSPEESSEDRQGGAGDGTPPDDRGDALNLLMQMPSGVIPPNDTENVLDGCDVNKDEETPDEALPASEGGVA